MPVTLGREVLARYPRFTLYNSPYVAHHRGCAIDLYPGGSRAPSPVAGEVLDTRTVTAPPEPYAAEYDHLIVLDVGAHLARVLHVEPAVAPGDEVKVGDYLGTMVRSGFFAPWVDNHVHLGFRERAADPYRASGSLPVAVDAMVEPLPWDGTGAVVETDDTYAILDSPAHPAPGEYFVGIECTPGVALDGGCPHYDGGGALPGAEGAMTLAGQRVGVAHSRDVTWDDIAVYANGEPITGVSLFFARDADFGAKLICPATTFEAGEQVAVEIRRN